jgi:DNA-3-methyladenine glycosylase II
VRPRWWAEAAEHLVSADPVFAALIEHAREVPWRKRGVPFAALARAVVGQQISVKAASSVWARVLAASGATASAPPDAAALRALDHAALRACGLSARKVDYLHALADHFLAPGFSLARLRRMSDEELIADLSAIHGIGRWTVEMFLMFHLHRPDVLPVGDLGLRAAAGSLYGQGGELPIDRLRALAQPWRPYATAATWLLWRYLEAGEEQRQAIRACRRPPPRRRAHRAGLAGET